MNIKPFLVLSLYIDNASCPAAGYTHHAADMQGNLIDEFTQACAALLNQQ